MAPAASISAHTGRIHNPISVTASSEHQSIESKRIATFSARSKSDWGQLENPQQSSRLVRRCSLKRSTYPWSKTRWQQCMPLEFDQTFRYGQRSQAGNCRIVADQSSFVGTGLNQARFPCYSDLGVSNLLHKDSSDVCKQKQKAKRSESQILERRTIQSSQVCRWPLTEPSPQSVPSIPLSVTTRLTQVKIRHNQLGSRLESGLKLETRRKGKELRAVRVEDLSPAVPQPEDEEPVDVKVSVGFVGETSDQVFSIQKQLPPPSVLVTVTLPKPLGIVFEESRIRKRVFVAELVPGGNAERAARVVQMFGSVRKMGREGASARAGGAVQKGDVLRGFTTTQCIVDLFGVRAPRRATVYFDTKKRRWGEIMGAFGAVRVSDGEITLVLERTMERL